MTQPRILRLRDAPGYCGMCLAIFKKEIKPRLTEIPIGKRGKGFDRLEIDRVLDQYIASHGRPPPSDEKEQQTWEGVTDTRGSGSGATSGGSTLTVETLDEFTKALAVAKRSGRRRSESISSA